jgi:hypothetical protein
MSEESPFNAAQIARFIEDGFLRLERAFPTGLADAGRAILQRDLAGRDGPVVRLGDYADPPFREAANTPRLRAAFDQLAGPGRWLPRGSLGTFPIRLPSAETPNDTGWHVDASFPGDDPADYFGWRVNVRSQGRALLMLFLFSDVGEDDAPTRLRVGSHLAVAKLLAPEGDAGLTFMQLAPRAEAATAALPEALATGRAGDVLLCHPFLVHAAQAHRGTSPRFMAQPPLLARGAFDPCRNDGAGSPVEEAIRRGIGPAGAGQSGSA